MRLKFDRNLRIVLSVSAALALVPISFNACTGGFIAREMAVGVSTTSSTASTATDVSPISDPPPVAASTPISVDRTNPRVIQTIVSPKSLDPAVDNWMADSYALVDTRVPSQGALVIFLLGAGTTPPQAAAYYLPYFAQFGAHVICLDYARDYGIDTGCAANDLTCYGKKRLEAIEGVDSSPLINVTPSNSLEQRLRLLLRNLAATQPQYGWNYFVDDSGEPRWDRIAPMGISHGSATAAYWGKLHAFDRVITLSGPDDSVMGQPSDWLSFASLTPADRYYAFDNVNEVRYPRYVTSFDTLGIAKDSFDLTNGALPISKSVRRLTLNVVDGDDETNHLSTIPYAHAIGVRDLEAYRYFLDFSTN